MAEKTSCYEICERKHDCYGGYLSEDKRCDREIERIKKKFKSEHPGKTVLFAPKNMVGLRFKIIAPQEIPDKVYILDNGEIHEQ